MESASEVGKVLVVFITARLNRNGRRFGFIRFGGVSNIQKLDTIWISNRKMHVHRSKNRRHEGTQKDRHYKILSKGRRKGLLEEKRYWEIL